MSKGEKSDIEELKGVMGALNETVPSLLSKVIDTIYNAEKDKKLAEGTANFYKELKEAGMDEEKAFELTREFMKSRDVSSLVEGALGGFKELRESEGSNIVEEKIAKEIEKETEEKE